jgi:hypothetical protein
MQIIDLSLGLQQPLAKNSIIANLNPPGAGSGEPSGDHRTIVGCAPIQGTSHQFITFFVP